MTNLWGMPGLWEPLYTGYRISEQNKLPRDAIGASKPDNAVAVKTAADAFVKGRQSSAKGCAVGEGGLLP